MVNSRAASETSSESDREHSVSQGERVTVNLTGKAAESLRRLQERTGYKKTDCINRALIIYEQMEEWSREPGGVYRRETPDGELMQIKFL